MSSCLHFVNYEQQPFVDHLVHSGPILLEYHDRCFATPLRHWPNERFTGCLYGNDGRISRLSQRPSSGAAFQPIDPEKLDLVPGKSHPQDGKAIYLGNLFAHFGHFILESLSRMWAARNFGTVFDSYYYHSWDGGVSIDKVRAGDLAVTCFNALGIPLERVRVVPDTGSWISNCLIPQQLFEVNRHVSKQFVPVLDSIVGYVKRSSPSGDVKPSDRLYLSRLHQPRRAENEEAIEAIFRDADFVIVTPELLSFQQQVALVSEAKIVAGCGGSNMHLAAFAQKATVISLDHRVIKNQLILEVLREHAAYHIWVRQERISPTRWVADENVIIAALQAVLLQVDA